jgi:uncharacterized membrane protein YbhN (UPF0104 family)
VTTDATNSRRSLVWMLRISVLVIVCIGVSGTVRHALADLGEHEWHLHPAWLIVSGVAYLLGMAPVAWFWHRTLEAFGYQPPLMATMRAYYFGQLGKYVPGKAMVIILRVAAMRRWAPSMRLVIVSVFLETLTNMAVGASLAFFFSVFVLKLDAYISLIALGMAGAAGGPTLPFALRLFGQIGAGRFARGDETKTPGEDPAEVASKLRAITYGVLASGWLAATIGWVLFGASLWGTLRAIGVDDVQLFANMPVLITAVAFAVVAGFLSMLPGGLVVRDAILLLLLSPVCGKANALVAAVLIRLVWLVSEVLACGILYIGRRIRLPKSTVANQDTQ